MLAAEVLRIGVDGLAISPAGKGHARTELHAVRALAERHEHELVVFVREPGAQELLAGLDVEIAQVTERPTILWELVGMPRAARRHRLDVMLTLTRAAAARRRSADGRLAVRVAAAPDPHEPARRGRPPGIAPATC